MGSSIPLALLPLAWIPYARLRYLLFPKWWLSVETLGENMMPMPSPTPIPCASKNCQYTLAMLVMNMQKT
jgi:hypothetical protein